jgi:hypothetical protein
MISVVTNRVIQGNRRPTSSFCQKCITVTPSSTAASEDLGQSFQNNEMGRDISGLLNTEQPIARPLLVHYI